jgi:hypothetical protein
MTDRTKTKLQILFSLLTIFGALYLAGEDEADQAVGYLEVVSPDEGNFEIYKIASEFPLQFFAEEIGSYNKKIPLSPGQYLILADCSSETIVIHPESTNRLVAHTVSFVAPIPPNEKDKFSIHCFRYAETSSRQHFTNRYALHLLSGTHDLLVGMNPLQVKLTNQTESEQVTYHLAGVKIESPADGPHHAEYFISPKDRLAPFTEPQGFGSWQFLLPGVYIVEVNGTQMEMQLAAGEEKTITAALLKVLVSDKVDLTSSSDIRGNPLYVELNDKHWLDIGDVYPVLPGKLKLRFNGSSVDEEVELIEGQSQEVVARSIQIDNSCHDADWNCLGSKTVYLYSGEEEHPYTEGVTDVPVLFFKKDIWASVQGSRDVKARIPDNQQDTRLKIGFVKINPQPHHVSGQISDLARVEAQGTQMTGNTLDLPFDKPTEIPLIAGLYNFVHYVSYSHGDKDRRKEQRQFYITPGKTVELTYNSYISEKQFGLYQKELEAKNLRKQALAPTKNAAK